MTITQIALCGDSIVQGFNVYDYVNGGKGCHAELIGDRLSNIVGLGPLLGPGFRGIWRDPALTNNSVEWSSAGSWTRTVSTDAFDKGLGGHAYYAASGDSTTRTWTKPASMSSIVGFTLYYVDYTNSGNWAFSVDGGTFHAITQTQTQTNVVRSFYHPVAVNSTVKIRASDDLHVAAGVCLLGIQPYYIDPRTAGMTGFILHNLGISGIDLHDVALSGSGDRLAWFDSVTTDPINPAPTHQPTTVIFGTYSNDVPDINNTTTWANDLTTVRNRVASFANVGFVNVYEQGSARNTTTQANYRAQLKTTAAGFSPAAPVYDIYDQWTALGIGTFLLARDPGLLLDAGSIHPSQLGYLDLADRLYYFIRDQILPSKPLTAINPFAVGSSGVGGANRLGGSIPAGQTVSATNAQTPSFIRSAGKILSFVQTQTASMLRSVGKILSLTQTQTRTAIRSVGKNISATDSQTPSLSRAAAFVRTLSAVETQAASMIRSALKILAFTQTQTASIVRSAGKILSFTQTQTLSAIRSVGKNVNATEAQTTTLATASAFVRTISAVEAQVASMIRSVGKLLTATDSQTPTLSAGLAFLRVLSAVEAQTSSLVRSVGKLLSATETQSLTGSRSVGKLITLTATQTLSAIRSIVMHALTATETQTPSAAANRAFLRALSAVQSQTAALVRSVGKLLSATESQSLSTIWSTGKTISVTNTQTPTVIKTIAKQLLVSAVQVASLIATGISVHGAGGIRLIKLLFRNDQRFGERNDQRFGEDHDQRFRTGR